MFTIHPTGSYVLSLLAILLLFSNCSRRISDNIPTIRYQSLRIEQIQPEVQQANLKLELAMLFRFKNPLNRDIIIPAHDLQFKLNTENLNADVNQQPSFTLHKKSERIVSYGFTFDLNPNSLLDNLNVLGKDNYFEMVSEFELDLADFGVNLPEQFSTYTFEVAFGDTIRLPLLPVIKTAGEAGSIKLLGEMENLDLRPFKQAASPFVSLLNGNFREQDPFIKLMYETKVPGTNVRVIDQVINTFFFGDERVKDQWEALRDKLYVQDSVSVMDQMVTTFLKHVNPNAANQWNTFNTQWNSFYENIPDQLEYPGHQITGIQVEIPFLIHNPNEFSITAPSFFSSAELPSFNPVIFTAAPHNATPTSPPVIAAQDERLMKLQMTLNWGSEENPGFDWLFNGNMLETTLKGSTLLDLGYGPVRVDMEVPLSLKPEH